MIPSYRQKINDFVSCFTDLNGHGKPSTVPAIQALHGVVRPGFGLRSPQAIADTEIPAGPLSGRAGALRLAFFRFHVLLGPLEEGSNGIIMDVLGGAYRYSYLFWYDER